VAFFGSPSRSKKWTLQFGGHHLAIHMTFSGSTVSNTPYFVGPEPRTAFKVNGKTYQPMADEATPLFGAVRALDSSQQAKAKAKLGPVRRRCRTGAAEGRAVPSQGRGSQ
jgi:hypothetical protein